MTQKFFRWILLLILVLFLTGTGLASATEEQIYTIKRGDTLWDLSQRFIDDPYYWPNVWAKNPDITNPHLIFPGQKIRILDGRLEIIPAYSEADNGKEETATMPLEETQSQPETVTIKSTGSGNGFILTDEKPLGFIADSVDNRVLLTKNDLVFVKMEDLSNVKVGDTFGLFTRGQVVTHPHTRRAVGTMMYNLGSLQVTEINGKTISASISGKEASTKIDSDTVSATINKVYREITRGAELYPYVPPQMEITLQRAPSSLKGTIVAARDEKGTLSTDDVIFIDRGRDDGVARGNLLYISRPRKASDELIKKAGSIQLPDEVLGAAVIIEAQKKTASAIIIKSVDASFVGDNITIISE